MPLKLEFVAILLLRSPLWRSRVAATPTCRFIDEKVAVLIAGLCGTGKSHLAQSLGHAAARQGYDVLFITQTQLMTSLRTAQAMGTHERRLQYLSKVALLTIDDFGLKPLRPPEEGLPRPDS